MTSFRRQRGTFVPLQANYFMDDAIIAAGNNAELAYLRSLAVAKLVDRDGYLMWTQCAPVRRAIRRWDDVVSALLLHNLWIPAPDGSGFGIRSWSEHNESRAEREVANALEASRKRVARERAGMTTPIDVSGRTSSRKRREEKKEGSDRTPSGSVRSEPARAAPRSAEGAAQHPPSSAEVGSAVDEARRAIAEARTKMRAKSNRPATTGNGKDERVDFSASLAKLTEAAERLKSEPTE